MDDSSLFMEWAMDTLQHHDHPPAAAAYHPDCGGDVFPSLKELCSSASHQNGTAMADIAAQDCHQNQATDSRSSGGDTESAGGGGGGCTGNTSAAVVEQHDGCLSSSVQCAPSSSVGSTNYMPVSWNFTSAVAKPSSSVGSTNYMPVSWNFTSAVAKPSNETTPPNPNPGTTTSRACDGSGAPDGSPRASAKSRAAASTGNTTSSPKPYAKDHIMAERKRREKINRRFIELSTVIPGLKKMDKATILSDAVRYVKEQQEKLEALEDRNGGARPVDSAQLAKKPCIAAARDGGGPSPSAAGTTRNRDPLPEIEVRISESEGSVMVRIHCENGKGMLVGLLAEVEELHLTITHTTVIPFQSCTVVITVMAKVDEGFDITAEDIVERLNTALHRKMQK